MKKFKNINIRSLSSKDLKQVKKFQEFINSLIEENAQITLNKQLTLKQETDFLKGNLKKIRRKKFVFLIAEKNNKIVATTGIDLRSGKEEHIGEFGIIIDQDYRGMGLGNYLMTEIIKLAKTRLKPKPKIIRLSVFPANKPAIGLYKKQGFQEVAVIPKQLKHKGKFVDELVMLLHL